MTNRRSVCSLIAGMGVLPHVAHAQGTWKLATGYRVESFHGQNLLQFTHDVAAAPGGLRIELHPNNSLFKLNDIAGAVRDAKVPCGETIMTSMTQEMPVAGADAVPFVVRSYDDARRLWKCQKPLIDRQFAASGLRPLMAVPWPPQGLYTNKPIARASDLRGTRMRTYNATTQRIAQLLGATPVDVPMVQVRQALAEGRIDCMITSAVTGVENQVWDQVKNYYEINAWFPKNITFANARAFDGLVAASQRSLLQAAAAAELRGWAASEKAATDSLEALRQHGMKIERVSAAFLADIKRLGERFSLEWIKAVGTEANEIFVPYYTQQ